MRVLVVFLVLLTCGYSLVSNITYDKASKDDFEKACLIITKTMGVRLADCWVNSGGSLKECETHLISALNFTDIGTICGKANLDELKLIEETYQEVLQKHIEYVKNKIKEESEKNAKEMQKVLDDINRLADEVEKKGW